MRHQQDHKEPKDLVVDKVLKVPKDHKVLRVQRDHKGLKVL